jgi:hypothetical protein
MPFMLHASAQLMAQKLLHGGGTIGSHLHIGGGPVLLDAATVALDDEPLAELEATVVPELDTDPEPPDALAVDEAALMPPWPLAALLAAAGFAPPTSEYSKASPLPVAQRAVASVSPAASTQRHPGRIAPGYHDDTLSIPPSEPSFGCPGRETGC